MTASNRFDRVLAEVLSDLAQPAYPDYIEDALDRATQRSQRPVWTFPERWLPMSTVARPLLFAPGLPWRNLAILMLALLAAAIAAMAIGSQRQPAPPYGPAKNGQVVYQVDGDIYAGELLGSEQRRLIHGPEFDVYPLFSRDGTRLAFFRIDPATLGRERELLTLMVANAAGEGVRALLGPLAIASMAWSPNSRELAVVTVDNGQHLMIVPIDGSAPREIDLDVPISEGVVTWRPPDGRELIFRTPAGGTNGFYAIGADGTNLRRISPEGVVLPAGGAVSLTPDGRLLTYMHMELPFSIRVVDLDTGQERLFGERLPVLAAGDHHAGNQQVSADGTKLLFGRYWDERDETINHQVWVASLSGDGSDAKAIGPIERSPSGRRSSRHPAGAGWERDLRASPRLNDDLGHRLRGRRPPESQPGQRLRLRLATGRAVGKDACRPRTETTRRGHPGRGASSRPLDTMEGAGSESRR